MGVKAIFLLDGSAQLVLETYNHPFYVYSYFHTHEIFLIWILLSSLVELLVYFVVRENVSCPSILELSSLQFIVVLRLTVSFSKNHCHTRGQKYQNVISFSILNISEQNEVSICYLKVTVFIKLLWFLNLYFSFSFDKNIIP